MRIYVGGISYNTNSDGLRRLFEQAGEVSEATIVEDKYSGQSKGFGFVEMPDAGDGQAAIAQFNGYNLDGRNLTVNEARPREERSGGGGGGRSGGGGGYGGGRRRRWSQWRRWRLRRWWRRQLRWRRRWSQRWRRWLRRWWRRSLLNSPKAASPVAIFIVIAGRRCFSFCFSSFSDVQATRKRRRRIWGSSPWRLSNCTYPMGRIIAPPTRALSRFTGSAFLARHRLRATPAELIMGYKTLTEDARARAEATVNEFLTEDEFHQLRAYLRERHGEDLRTTLLCAPVSATKPDSGTQVGLERPFAQCAPKPGSGFHRLSEEEGYTLPFEVWGYYSLPARLRAADRRRDHCRRR